MATHKFESVAALGRAVDAIKYNPRCRRIYNQIESQNDWAGDSFKSSIEKALKGDISQVAEAEKLLDNLRASIEVRTKEWNRSTCGAFPCVPHFLIGHPEAMYKLEDTSSDTAPIRIYVCTTSSDQVKWQHLRDRGITILAATMALCQVRPVELWTFTAFNGNGKHGEYNAMVRINATPLCLSEACFALCSPGFDRQLAMAYGYTKDSYNGGWADCVKGLLNNEQACIKASRKMLGANDNDLIVPPFSIHFTQIASDPVGWMKKILEQYTITDDDTLN